MYKTDNEATLAYGNGKNAVFAEAKILCEVTKCYIILSIMGILILQDIKHYAFYEL